MLAFLMVIRNTEPTIITTTPAIIYDRRFIGVIVPTDELLPFVPVVEIEAEVSLLPAETDEVAEEDDAELDEECVEPEVELESEPDTLDVELKKPEELLPVDMEDEDSVP